MSIRAKILPSGIQGNRGRGGGIKLNPDDLKVVHVIHRDSGEERDNERIDVFFLAENYGGEITNKEPHKCGNLSWFDLDDLPENMIPYVSWVIRMMRNKVFYSEYGWQ